MNKLEVARVDFPLGCRMFGSLLVKLNLMLGDSAFRRHCDSQTEAGAKVCPYTAGVTRIICYNSVCFVNEKETISIFSIV